MKISVNRRVEAPAEAVYDLVGDVARMGEWSPENEGGEWLDGASGPAVGARFRGRNRRKAAWTTTAVVTAAERGRVFAFAVGKPGRPDTAWRYDLRPDGDGCDVTETCEILREPGRVGRWLTKLGTGVAWADRPADLRAGMAETLRRLDAAATAI